MGSSVKSELFKQTPLISLVPSVDDIENNISLEQYFGAYFSRYETVQAQLIEATNSTQRAALEAERAMLEQLLNWCKEEKDINV